MSAGTLEDFLKTALRSLWQGLQEALKFFCAHWVAVLNPSIGINPSANPFIGWERTFFINFVKPMQLGFKFYDEVHNLNNIGEMCVCVI